MSPRKLCKQQSLASFASDPEALMDAPTIRAFFSGKGATTFQRWRTHPDPEQRFPDADLYLGNVAYSKRATVIAFRDHQAKHRDARMQAIVDRAAQAQAAKTQSPDKQPPAANTAGSARSAPALGGATFARHARRMKRTFAMLAPRV
jgi:hypothetical protein